MLSAFCSSTTLKNITTNEHFVYTDEFHIINLVLQCKTDNSLQQGDVNGDTMPHTLTYLHYLQDTGYIRIVIVYTGDP